MHENTVGNLGKHKVPGEGQEYPEAEDLERMPAADDSRPARRRLERRPVRRHQPDRDHRQRQEMQNAQNVEIGLVDGVDGFADEFRHVGAECRKIPGHRNSEREGEVAESQGDNHPRLGPACQPGRAAEGTPGAKYEQQLPGQRIERPVAARIGRQIPFEHPRHRVDRGRHQKRQRWRAQQQPQDRREPEQQHDIERQHIHVDRFELQQQRLDDGDIRIVEKVQHAHFFRIERVVEGVRDVGNLGKIDREQKDMRDIDLPGALKHAGGGNDEAAHRHRPAIDEGGGIAGDEHEDFSGVGKAVIADGDPAHQIGRNMVEKDQPEGEPAKQIKPEIAFGRDRGHEENFFRPAFQP